MTSAAFDDANEQLATFGVPLPTRSTISEAAAAAGVGVHAATSTDYVSITAQGASQIAIYVHKNEVSVALDPEDASHAAAAYAYCRLEPAGENAPTRYVKIGHGPVRLYSSIVRDLFVTAPEALTLLANGPDSDQAARRRITGTAANRPH